MIDSTSQTQAANYSHSPKLVKQRKSFAMLLVGFGLMGILGLGLLAVINLNQRNQDLASKAAPTTTISATTAQSTIVEGQTFSVEIQANTGSNVVKAADIGLVYDPTYLQLLDITKGNWFGQAFEAVKTIDQATGKTLLGLVIPPTAVPAYVTGQGTVSVATFKALKATTNSTISFDHSLTLVGAANERQNAIASYNSLALSIVTQEVIPPSSDNFIIYSYEACFSQNSDGHSTYLLWKPLTYANVTTIDVSEHSDFSQVSRKNVAGTTSSLASGYLLTDGTNFRLNGADSGALMSYKPEVTYYFRLNYGTNLTSPVVAYKLISCAGTGGVSIKQCNEACSNSSECLTNLTCSNNICRRISNEGDNKCVLPPDQGIHRACNEYCSDNKECGNGYTCWWNQCRNPRDLTNATCKVALKPGEVEGCNLYCANDGECASGLKCWWNQCRLPKNLNSTTCQIKPTAAPYQYTGSAVPTRVVTRSVATPTKAATISANIKIDSSPTPTFIMLKKPSLAPVVPTVQPTKTPSNGVSNFLNMIPVLLVVIFVALIGLLFGPQLLATIKAKAQPPSSPPTA